MMPTVSTGALSAIETATLATYETVIQQGLESFVEVGNALAAIRDKRLYRSEFANFGDYCGARWNLAKSSAYQLIAAAEVAEDVSAIADTKPATESQARPLASVPKEDRAAVWQEAVDTAPKDAAGKPKITAAHVQSVVDENLGKPHVANNSGNDEWYTPALIADAAREVLKQIDCDPASSEKANEVIRAKRIYTIDDCGLAAAKWGKKVWMNPPYSQPLCKEFCESLVQRFADGEVTEACVIVNNATETGWFRGLVAHAAAVVFLSGRVKFLDANGEPKNSPLQGQSVLYFGDRFTAFLESFAPLGWGAIVQ